MTLLEIKNLKTYFYLDGETLPAVDDVSFSLKKNETLALIGESGSGKSVTALSIMQLVDPPGKIIQGEVWLEGEHRENLLLKSEKEMQKIRGNHIAMIYQDPLTTLNPLNRVGEQVAEALFIHRKGNRKEIRDKALSLMKTVGIADAEKLYHHLPGQFSGGMRQRIMIAMGIACEPRVLIADEPTTALDVTIQAEILALLQNLQRENGMAILLNTHDLGVVSDMADEVCVMYCGKIMEKASKERLFTSPLHPYTRGLMECMPGMGEKRRRLNIIDGYVPHAANFPKGCRFSNRCPHALGTCSAMEPEFLEVEDDHWARCWLLDRIER